MAKFSTTLDQSFEVLEAAIRLRSKVARQVREGAQNQGDRELQRTAHNVNATLGYLADVLVQLGNQTQTLGWEQIGEVTKTDLDSIANQLRDVAAQLPALPQ